MAEPKALFRAYKSHVSRLCTDSCTRQGSNLQPCDPKSQESMFNDVRESPHLGT